MMKNRIWKQAGKTGIAAISAGMILLGNGYANVAADTDFSSEKGIWIQQKGSWTDREKGKALLDIQINGLKEWAEQNRNITEKEEEPEEIPGKEETVPEGGEIQEQGEVFSETEEIQMREEEIQNQEEWEEKMAETEMEDGYEYMEELAPGETVQPENEIQEEEGARPQEGTQTGGKDVEVGEIVSEEVFLETYIAEYFSVESSELPENVSAQQIETEDQKNKNAEITKLEYKIPQEDMDKNRISLEIPVTLREEYRYPLKPVTYPLVQESGSPEDGSGAGTYLFTEKEGERMMLAEGVAPFLEVEAAKADMSLSLVSETKEMKAGKTIRYRLDLENTGKTDLQEIRLSSRFSCPKITQLWEEAGGLAGEGADVELSELKAGERRSFYILAPLENEQEKDLEHQVQAEAVVKGRTEEHIFRKAFLISPLKALKAAFSVKKTADREKAEPGETVTYQICILNTGEKTLHSVVGTERFQAEGVEARFVEQKGITLNSTGTKALIEKIAPGEAVSLQAVVKIPEKTVDQKLFNEVTVTSKETGEKQVKASAQIQVQGKQTTVPKETEIPEKEEVGSVAVQENMAREASTHPKTGDDTEADLFILLGITACMTGLGVFWLRKKYAGIHRKS